jgi:hypothetical protein
LANNPLNLLGFSLARARNKQKRLAPDGKFGRASEILFPPTGLGKNRPGGS